MSHAVASYLVNTILVKSSEDNSLLSTTVYTFRAERLQRGRCHFQIQFHFQVLYEPCTYIIREDIL